MYCILILRWLLYSVAVVKSTPVETPRTEDIYEETRKVEADMTFSTRREALATSQGMLLISIFF